MSLEVVEPDDEIVSTFKVVNVADVCVLPIELDKVEVSTDACAVLATVSTRAVMVAEAEALVVAEASAVLATELMVVNCEVRAVVDAATVVEAPTVDVEAASVEAATAEVDAARVEVEAATVDVDNIVANAAVVEAATVDVDTAAVIGGGGGHIPLLVLPGQMSSLQIQNEPVEPNGPMIGGKYCVAIGEAAQLKGMNGPVQSLYIQATTYGLNW